MQTPGEPRSRSPSHSPIRASPRRWVLMVLVLPLAAGAAGCGDAESPIAPVEVAPTASAVGANEVQQSNGTNAQVGPATAAVAIEDVLDRVLPALETGGPTAGLSAGLSQLGDLLENGGGGSGGLQSALTQVQDAVDKYQAQAGDEFQPDITVLRLALDAVANS